MPVRKFTSDRLSDLIDFAEVNNSWGDKGRDLGRRTFRETLGQPGFGPEDNCLLLEQDDRIQGYCLLISEPTISRVVLEPKVIPELIGSSQELELVRRALERARDLEAGVAHLCLPDASPQAEVFMREGFSLVRSYLDMVWREDSLPALEVPDGFTVQAFQPGDASLLTEVQNSAFAASWGFSPNTVEQIEYRSSMANTSHKGILFLRHGDKTAGYCWTCLVPVEGSIRGMIGMIGVVPEYRGQGISNSILLAGMEYLRSLDLADLGLQVDGSNTPATRLYTSVGFQTAGELHWFERGLS